MANNIPLQNPAAASVDNPQAAMASGYADHVDPDMSGASSAADAVQALADATWAAAQPVK